MKNEFPLLQIVDENGNVLIDSYEDVMTEDRMKEFYYHMVRLRTYDQKGKALQRQGRIGTYVPFEGQEASQVGSALALEKDDWMFPTYRDHGAALTFGGEMHRLYLYWNGRVEGSVPSLARNIVPASVPIATQLPHAAGAAMAEKYKGTKNAAIAYFGDGATSEGDFHEGINIASVFKAPAVFFNQNNGYAISVPFHKQTNSETVAQKAVAYGIPGVRVDGMDVFSVYVTVKNALDRAREGEGPTLIEAVVTRFGPHTTADDPTKYRNQEKVEQLREKIDPILRLERLMKNRGVWDDAWVKQIEEEIMEEVEKAVTEMESFVAPNPADMFDHVFEEPTWTLLEQKEALLGRSGT